MGNKEKEVVNDFLYKEVALELGVTEKVVKDVILNGESKCTVAIMSSNTFDGVKWPYLGTFKAKHKAIQILQHMRGLSPIQKDFFLAALRAGKYKEEKK